MLRLAAWSAGFQFIEGHGQAATVFSIANFIVIAATIIALPIGRASERNDGKYIFATTGNLTTWPTGWGKFEPPPPGTVIEK